MVHLGNPDAVRGGLLVFDEGSWWSTPVGGREPISVGIDAMGIVLAPNARIDVPTPPWADPDALVTTREPRLLRRRAGRLVAWDDRGQVEVSLDALDVELMTRRFPIRYAEFVGLDPLAAERLSKMVTAGILACDLTPAPGRWPLVDAPTAPVTVGAPADHAARDPSPAPPGSPTPTKDPRTRVLASADIDRWGQPLALGGLLAYARVAGDGRLAKTYDIRPVMQHADLLDELERDDRPAIVLFSDYVWSAADNLEVAAAVAAHDHAHLVVHGGPHAPRYEGDLARHFAAHPAVDVIAHGEGEITLVELLDRLDGDPTATDRLLGIEGLSVRRPSGFVTAAERPRHDRLDDFPSPYLSGEFDHLDTSTWEWPSIETNRGCPYACTFCDWGSATRSRIRSFPMERVLGELDWLAAHGLKHWMVNDANFGIHQRDVEIARHIVELRRAGGTPEVLYMNYAKNTITHLAEIIGMFIESGITTEGALALQTRDADTLTAIRRSNIRLDAYDQLAEQFRRHGLPLVTDLIVGLPGQTCKSLLADMQYCVDADITPRFFVALMLPNAEFNDPTYRDRFHLVIDAENVVVSSSSFDRDERERMMRLRMAYRCFEHLGLLRHVFRSLQWDHGVHFAEALERTERRIHDQPDRYQLLSWVVGYLDVFLIPPSGWTPFYEEVERFVADEFGLLGDDIATVLAVQRALMPSPDRQFPDVVHLPHDYVRWYRSHVTGRAVDRLVELPPGTLSIDGDPLLRCAQGIRRLAPTRPPDSLAAPFWTSWHWELDSPLQRVVTETAVERSTGVSGDQPADAGELDGRVGQRHES